MSCTVVYMAVQHKHVNLDGTGAAHEQTPHWHVCDRIFMREMIEWSEGMSGGMPV